MHRRIAELILFFSGMPVGAVTIVSRPSVDAVTVSTARFYWNTDVPSDTSLKYGLTSSYGKTVVGASPTQNQINHAWFLSGLAPATTYHYSVCSSDGKTSACSPDDVFTTLPLGAGKHPADPELPRTAGTPLLSALRDSTPQLPGQTLMVGADCDDPSSGLVARWKQARWGDTVVIPLKTVCSGSYHFPAKVADRVTPHRWITTRSEAAGDLPPEGTRIDPSYADKMPLLRANVLNTAVDGLPNQRNYQCSAGSYFWSRDQPGFQMRRCVNDRPRQIESVSGNGVAPIAIKVSGHGLVAGDLIWISGVQGNTAANGNFLVASVPDANTITLNAWSWGTPAGNGDYQGGGTISKNVWSGVIAHGEGPSLPASCGAGDWFYKISSAAAVDNVFRCVAANTWEKYPVRTSSDWPQFPVINLSDNAAHHLRFTGLHLGTVPIPPEPLWAQAPGNQSGSIYFTLVHQDVPNHDIIWDRCWFEGPAPPGRIRVGGHFEGKNISILDSYFNQMQWWLGPLAVPFADFESQAISFDKGPGPARIENNYIEAYGISLYASDDFNSVTPVPSDYEILRNTFYRSETHRYGSPTSDGFIYVLRHHLELKRGVRWLIDGNIFDTNWAVVNNAAAIALSPRPGPGHAIQTIKDGVVATYYTQYFKPGARVAIYYNPNPAHNGVWIVESVGDSTHFKLAGMTGSSAGGYLNQQDNDATVADIWIRNNTFRHLNTGVYTIGHTDGGSYPFIQNPVMARLRIHNNIFEKFDGKLAIPNGSFPQGYGPTIFYTAYGPEDFQFTHNTLWGNPDNTTTIALDNVSLANPGSGFSMTDNILYYGTWPVVMSGSYFGIDGLNKAFTAGDAPSWTFARNVIAKQGAAPTTPPFGPYPPQNSWFDLSGGKDLPFQNPGADNFQLTSTFTAGATCFTQSGDCSTDGSDVGVNMQQLQSAQGLVTNVAVSSRAAQTVLAYEAPDTRACTVEYGNDPALRTKKRVADGGGARKREVVLERVEPGTNGYYRISCYHPGPVRSIHMASGKVKAGAE